MKDRIGKSKLAGRDKRNPTQGQGQSQRRPVVHEKKIYKLVN